MWEFGEIERILTTANQWSHGWVGMREEREARATFCTPSLYRIAVVIYGCEIDVDGGPVDAAVSLHEGLLTGEFKIPSSVTFGPT